MRVSIIGAGPAGSAAAIELARAGADVTIYEKSAWPRSKTCGDGLTPSSVLELRVLGLVADGPELTATLISGPSETAARAGWPADMPAGTTMERRRLDAMLVDAAITAGARFEPGVTIRTLDEFDSGVVILAEGAAGGLAQTRGFPSFRSRLAAIRGYVDVSHDVAPEYAVHYGRALTPGYAWLFPVGPRRINVGLAVDTATAARAGGDLRALLRYWLKLSRFARAALGDAVDIGQLTGGIIPTGRAIRARGNVLLVGDAAGVADPLSAEGVSQALASGRDAARALVAAGGDPVVAGPDYERRLARFDANEREARRMRALFGLGGDVLVRLAARRPRLASYLIETGYFLKRDTRWFSGTLARALKP